MKLQAKSEDEIRNAILKLAETNVIKAFDILYKKFSDDGHQTFTTLKLIKEYLSIDIEIVGASRRVKALLTEDDVEKIYLNPTPDYIEDSLMLTLITNDNVYHHGITI